MKKLSSLLLVLLLLTMLSCGLLGSVRALDVSTPVISGSPILVLNP